jgi:hypothetical protein
MKQNFATDVKYSNTPERERKQIATAVRSAFQSQLQLIRNNFSNRSMDLIKGMYRQLDFINKVCVNFNYWIREEVIFASIERYEKFIQLMKVILLFFFLPYFFQP